ncbi:DUF4136 domain-containing protein [Fulvivirgaceae bacterium PWU4]|uniref:DUF4136 domain-containing protein n=1 Tax=Chryseosolibacter histidini TaxID=2782349 RepID=A0AAP2GR10_9BACT|nr:DUF4136 domain-containing protein [Chryseosolibacter histidini]MBT1699535.1 DUF4136 domain-containing protein [Chryseosolibacter histidini]
MKSKHSIPLLLLMITGLSCETPLKVTSDYDRSANFSNYKSFAMRNFSEKDQAMSELNANRIINAIRAEMIAKGFEEDNDTPDLKVNAVTIMTNKKEVTATTNYYDYGGVYRPYSWGVGMGGGHTTFNVDDYTDGSLIIEVIDTVTGRLIWEGIGNKEIDTPSSKPDVTIPAAVAKIMKSFPPPVKKK